MNLDTEEYLDPIGFADDTNVNFSSLERGGVMKGLFSCFFYSTERGGGDIDKFRMGHHLAIFAKENPSPEFVDISDHVLRSILDY